MIIDLHACPSGECQEYIYPKGWFSRECAPGTVPRPVEVVIHTREAFFECERLNHLMNEPMPSEKGYYDGPGDDPGWQDSTFPNER